MEDLIRRLCSCRECAINELLQGVEADRIEVRKLVARLVREGLVEKKPDYDKRKMVFRVRDELCVGLS
ncbi:MAG: hypothetical protein GSR74_03270 [Desulfurococcales archaeon]|nr:hypothetical protein [Desulfurococcales archaeon]